MWDWWQWLIFFGSLVLFWPAFAAWDVWQSERIRREVLREHPELDR